MNATELSAQATAGTPATRLRDLITGFVLSRAVYVAASLEVADLLANGPSDAQTLARACGAEASALYRVLRTLASVGVFTEGEDGKFSNTPMSELLRSDVPGSLRALSRMYGDDDFWAAWGLVLLSVRTGDAAMNKVIGMHPFEYNARHPEKAKVFDQAMVSSSSLVNRALTEAYDFSRFGRLVDVAGGYGSTLCAVLKATPGLRGVLFDMPHVIEGARPRVAEQGLADRVEFASGNMFESVPAGADAYFMKHILHDWDDAACGKILAAIRAAVPPHGRLLVSEKLILPGPTGYYAKIGDLVMLVHNQGGRERTEAEFRDLFAAAGFKLVQVVPTAADHSVLEAVRA
jgi:O-methyltransferase domain/Dimerisation domain